ncbi:MAG: hypothetical protein ACREBU_19760, partial [Nitrososphaera sp.]
ARSSVRSASGSIGCIVSLRADYCAKWLAQKYATEHPGPLARGVKGRLQTVLEDLAHILAYKVYSHAGAETRRGRLGNRQMLHVDCGAIQRKRSGFYV